MNFTKIFVFICIISNELSAQFDILYYNNLTRSADSLYGLGEYKESATLYSRVFRLNNQNNSIEDHYRAACSWALANYPDSAFLNLENISNVYLDYSFIINDPDLISLHNDKRWLIIISKIKLNGEKVKYLRRQIADSSIVCDTLINSNWNIYRKLNNYKCISIGEMHGSIEPVSFLIGLVKTFYQNKKKIIVGFEVSESSMAKFIKEKNKITLAQTVFFEKGFGDGRNSDAWYKAIDYINELGIKLCFFDGLNSFEKFENLMSCYKVDTNVIVLTISGNIHNRVIPYNGNKTMGCYLKNYFGKGMLSIGHVFKQGTMYNLTSTGLKVHTLNKKDTFFSTSTKYSNYFIFNILGNGDNGYDAFLYTTNITASLPYKLSK